MGTARKSLSANEALVAVSIRPGQPGFAARKREIAAHEKRLRTLATKLRTAAKRIDLAATYAGDGATATAEAITYVGRKGERSAVSLALEVVRALNGRRWRI